MKENNEGLNWKLKKNDKKKLEIKEWGLKLDIKIKWNKIMRNKIE
jgi:hypothetical protein